MYSHLWWSGYLYLNNVRSVELRSNQSSYYISWFTPYEISYQPLPINIMWESLADNSCGGAKGQRIWCSRGKICKRYQNRGNTLNQNILVPVVDELCYINIVWEKRGTTWWGDYMVKGENDIIKELQDEETKWWQDYMIRWLNDKETR